MNGCYVVSARPYVTLSDEKSVVEHNPAENLVFLSMSIDAFPSSWTVQWFKDDVPVDSDNPRFTATYVMYRCYLVFVCCQGITKL